MRPRTADPSAVATTAEEERAVRRAVAALLIPGPGPSPYELLAPFEREDGPLASRHVRLLRECMRRTRLARGEVAGGGPHSPGGGGPAAA